MHSDALGMAVAMERGLLRAFTGLSADEVHDRRVAGESITDIVESEGVESTDVVEEALAAHFPGSPTVRIAGVDVDPGIRLKSDFGMG